MKLCLFNVENFFLFEHPNFTGPSKPVDKIEWIAKTITEIDADIIMLCEIGGVESLTLFNSKYLNNQYYTAILKGNSDRDIEMGYLIKKSYPYAFQHFSHADMSIDFNYDFEIEENKKNRDGEQVAYLPHKFSRDISELRLIQNNQVVLIILLVHLKSKWDRDGVDSFGAARRKAEVQTLIKTYNKLRVDFHFKVPIIVAGDLNGMAQKGLQEAEFNDLYKFTDLEDVMEVMNLPHEQRFSFFYFNKDKHCEASQLDYILLPKELHPLVKKEDSGIYLFKDLHGVSLPYPKESYQRYALPADHYPVVACLDFL